MKKIVDFFHYLLGKSSEIGDLETKDALLAKTVLDIHRKKSNSSFIFVPLFSLQQIHAIDRDNAIKATNERVDRLIEVKETLLAQKIITREFLARYLPSVSWIKVVQVANNQFVSFEGNGRLAALQQVFSPADGIQVEVEEYTVNTPGKIVRRMRRVQRLNGVKTQ